MEKNKYISPFSTRYASDEMQYVFSEEFKFKTWRRLWIELAKAEKALGLDITDKQIAQLEAHAEDINFEVAEAREREVRHDVMSHVYAYGKQCPDAEPIIHLGATSCYVGDNTDVIILKKASEIILKKAAAVVKNLADFAGKYKDMPCLAYTHLQPAQLTTVGKRATLWMYELLQDIEELEHRLSGLLLLGSKGTTGTQASFMELFDGDEEKIKKMEQMIADALGFSGCVPVSGQTYSRKADYFILSVLSGIAQSAQKFSGDIRLLSHLKEFDEPFEAGQVGSSAMAYKRNPMRSERISSLSRFVIAECINPAMTAGTQWLERSLDDSANRRISIPEAFLATDGILQLYINIVSGLRVYPEVIKKNLNEELPFMATENILMHCVKNGGDRQLLHEAIRSHSVAAGLAVKQEGKSNDLLDRIANDPEFGLTRADIDKIISESCFTGIATQQTEDYLREVRAVLAANREFLDKNIDVSINV